MSNSEKPERSVFVIMPFVEAGGRNETQLTAFFKHQIQRPIESASLDYSYRVHRSGEAFDINTEIIRELVRADVVIADLSGEMPNPNVMYELGIRLAISDQPVILIRQDLPSNRRIFDIAGFYTFDYDPLNPGPLEEHLVSKLRRFETGEEVYSNRVRRIILDELTLLNPDVSQVPPDRQRDLVLRGIRSVASMVTRAYGPHGVGLSVVAGGTERLERRGAWIASAVSSRNPFEQRGINLMAVAGRQMSDDMTDGSKLPIILAHALIEEGVRLIGEGVGVRHFVRGMQRGAAIAADELRAISSPAEGRLMTVAHTAAKTTDLPADVVEALRLAGADGLVAIEEGSPGSDTVRLVEGMTVTHREVPEDFFSNCPGHRCTLEDCLILIYPERISVMKELLPALKVAADAERPLVLIADRIEGEALQTLVVNHLRGTVRCIPLSIPGMRDQKLPIMDDLAAYTGATIVTPQRGFRLESIVQSDLGRAGHVVVTSTHTEFDGGGGDPRGIARRADIIRAALAGAGDYEREKLQLRLARLVARVVTIIVGGSTEHEIRERRYELESALASVSIARRTDAVVTGAGAALAHVASKLRENMEQGGGEKAAGMLAVSTALEAPLRTIARASGMDPDEAIKAAQRDSGCVFNADTGTIEDPADLRILDSTALLIRAVEIAAATAAQFLEAGSWTVGHREVTSAS
ncbi:MAG TPA: TCP-1/cpn60 chaperonin family protein [Longimicrobiales bacterium]